LHGDVRLFELIRRRAAGFGEFLRFDFPGAVQAAGADELDDA
jgi:hypothetical protein